MKHFCFDAIFREFKKKKRRANENEFFPTYKHNAQNETAKQHCEQVNSNGSMLTAFFVNNGYDK